MEYGDLVVAKDIIMNLDSSYKQLDITSQITQLNALSKIGTSTGLNETVLGRAIDRRLKRLNISLMIVLAEESLWDLAINKASELLVSPDTNP